MSSATTRQAPTGADPPRIRTVQRDGRAVLRVDGRVDTFAGAWVEGGPWQRFGRYDRYVVVRHDGAVECIPAHAGELVPGSTEDLVDALRRYDPDHGHPHAPMTLELDPTYRCTSRDCGGRCFSAAYRALAPSAQIPTSLLRALVREFAAEGGRIVRFDGGGEPLAHEAVRNGELPELAARSGLKSTILTSGDLLERTNLERIGAADCYLRVSLNAATDETRRRFHGNRISLRGILAAVERFARWLSRENPSLPIGATFLLDVSNYREALDCAVRARDAGISHFSVRRVLGPSSLRPGFSAAEEDEIGGLLESIRGLGSESFRVFVPWRSLGEGDLDPSAGTFSTARCWQSTFKTVVEPDPDGGGCRAQLCGRYRGGGVGQRMQLPALFSSRVGDGWTERWRRSFGEYGIAREALPRTCVSCIDRGFITMIDRLVRFLGDPRTSFRILHLRSERHGSGSRRVPGA